LNHNFPHYLTNGTILENVIQNEICILTFCTKFCLKNSCHILVKLEDCRRIFEEYSNTKFH